MSQLWLVAGIMPVLLSKKFRRNRRQRRFRLLLRLIFSSKLSSANHRAKTVLGVFYVLGMCVVGSETVFASVPPEKTVLMLYSENVVINHAPVEPDITLGADHSISLFSGQSVFKFTRLDIGFGAVLDHELAKNRVAGNVKRLARKVLKVSQTKVDFLHDGRRLAVILEGAHDRRSLFSTDDLVLLRLLVGLDRQSNRSDQRFYFFVSDNDKQLSALGLGKGIGGLFGGVGGDPSGASQTNRENAKNDGEDSYNYGAECGNDRVFVSDVRADAMPVRWEHADESGDVFFKILFGWIILSVDFYALLKIQ
jgi:hypothetical protein